jgi:hypothetical protein
VKEINDEDEIEVSHEQISDWFYEGNAVVWNYLAPKTCGYFTLENPIRRFCIETLLSSWFDWAILLAILGNSLFIAANNPLDNKNEEVSQQTQRERGRGRETVVSRPSSASFLS